MNGFTYYADVRMKLSDMVVVKRCIKFSLNPYHAEKMTLREAVARGAWDTCNGTMNVIIETPAGEPVVRGKNKTKNGFPIPGTRTGNRYYAQVATSGE